MEHTLHIGIIANSTSPENRVELIEELGQPENGFFAPLKFNYKALSGAIIPLDIQPQDVFHLSGVRKARKALIGAVDYLAAKGVQVICLAASTKRLAGKSGELLKSRHPGITFTIGDNATNISFKNLIRHGIQSADFNKETDVAACMGGGFLGAEAVNCLLQEGCKNIVMVSEYQQSFANEISIVTAPDALPNGVSLFVSCTHKYNLQANALRCLKENATIIDVAVPAGVGQPLFDSLSPKVVRYNAGDFYLRDLRYRFQPGILSIPVKEVWYGCFTEAVLLGIARNQGDRLENYNFFEINAINENLINRYLKNEGICIPLINFYQKENIKLIAT